MVQLGVTDNPKENLDKKPIGEAPSTVVVLPTAAPPRAKSKCCTKRVKIAVIVVCFAGALVILGLLGVHLFRPRAFCGTDDSDVAFRGGFENSEGDGVLDGDWDGDQDGNRHDGRVPDGSHGDGDMDRSSEDDGRDSVGGHRGGHDGRHDGRHDGGHDGDRDGDHIGDHDGGDRGGDRPDGGPPPPAPPEPSH